MGSGFENLILFGLLSLMLLIGTLLRAKVWSPPASSAD